MCMTICLRTCPASAAGPARFLSLSLLLLLLKTITTNNYCYG